MVLALSSSKVGRLYLDNGHNIGNKAWSLTFKTSCTMDDTAVVKSIKVDSRFTGWVTCFLC